MSSLQTNINGVSVVQHYGDPMAEYHRLRRSVGVLDLSFRGRVCVAGADRMRFLHGQVTNEINKLPPGQGCYAAITNAKGKMVADANIYPLENEILLDFEPGITPSVFARLENYIIADDVQILTVSDHYNMLALIGPKAGEVLNAAQLGVTLPDAEQQFLHTSNREGGDIYCMRHSHGAGMGFDIFLPVSDTQSVFERLLSLAAQHGGGPAGWEALETLRIEAGIPRFKQDMDESNLAPETGIEARAISYSKGCYIGQEVIARIRTYGQVAKALRGLKLTTAESSLPNHRDLLFFGDREVGYLTSVIVSSTLNEVIALGYVRREHNEIGTELIVQSDAGNIPARIVELPFVTP
jgi:folate-binding protein YgfZ